MTAPIMLTVSRRFAAPPERLFDAWLDPAAAGRFLFATPDGVMEKVAIDPSIGGGFEIVERRPAGLAKHVGRFESIVRPRRIVFLFRATMDDAGGGDDDWTRVTIALAPDGDGCVLTLTHEMDPQWAAYEHRTVAGWTMILATLAETMGDDR
jgi:uncharacterized protein YndB with AHSA1/START domain